MQRSDEVILNKLLKEIDFAIGRLSDISLDSFLNDIDAQHSVGMAVINVGELIKHISDELRTGHADVPWKQAAGFRDVAAHAYDTIRMDDLYQTVIEDFPVLKEKLLQII